jgi:uncharacterized protein
MTAAGCHEWGGVGVGVMYNGALANRLASNPDMVDAVSLVPETLWHESADRSRHRWIASEVELFEASVIDYPTVFHGIGLSLGSGLPLDLGHLDQVVQAAERYRPLWYSEHLAAFRVGHASGLPAHAGVGLPVPFDQSTLHLLVPKVADVVSRVGFPLLLENSAIYVEIPDAEMTEAAFLNRLCEETGAGILLDLHNLFVNEVNLGWNSEQYLAELDLARVVEIHVAGGEMLGRWYTDAHSGACPDRVWELLDAVVAVAPALRLVTLELHGTRVEELGWARLDEQFSRIRSSAGRAMCRVA